MLWCLELIVLLVVGGVQLVIDLWTVFSILKAVTPDSHTTLSRVWIISLD